MLRQPPTATEGTSRRSFSPKSSLQSRISSVRRAVGRPALAYNSLIEQVKVTSAVHSAASGSSFHVAASVSLHFIDPRFFSHLLVVVMAAVVATASGMGAARVTRGSTLQSWQFEPFAARSFSRSGDFLDNPILPSTILASQVSEAGQTNQPSQPSQTKRGREAILTYDVAAGDTMTGIAARFGVSVETLLTANNLDDADSLGIGDKLIILPISGILHTVSSGDTVDGIAVKYKVESKTIIESEYNDLSEPYLLFIGQKLIVPGGTKPVVPRPLPVVTADRPTETQAPQPAQPSQPSQPTQPSQPAQPAAKGETAPPPAPTAPARGGTQFVWPTSGPITQGYSGYHWGIDIAPPYGTPIYAAGGGVVVSVEYLTYNWGWNLIIDHGNGLMTRYAHVSKFLVSQGQQVSRSQPIALVGSTGRSTGPHLHFEVYQGGVRVNPMKFLP